MDYTLFGENAKEDYQIRKRKKKRPSEPKFKDYNQNQLMLLPPSTEDMIPEKHIVRTVNRVIDNMKIDPLVKTYKGGGRKAYDPLMLLKVLVYAYLMRIYSSREIAKALRENVNFMWLSGMQRPDFRTINNFRSGRLKKVMEGLFSSMVMFLSENKYIKIEDYFVDGTKIEANANKYSYVWANNTKRYKKNVQKKIKELIEHINKVNEEENKRYGDRDLEELGEDALEITSEKIEKQVERLNKIINPTSEDTESKRDDEEKEQEEKEEKKSKNKSKRDKRDKKDKEKKEENKELKEKQRGNKNKRRELQKALNQISKKYLPKLKKYEQQERILGQRSSYSKTDIDSTFFRNKEEQYRPGYNVIIGTENQIILNYSLHQKASETDKFIEHMSKLKQITNQNMPKRVIGDGAYGSEENYDFLEKENIESYLKYTGFYQEEIKGVKRNDFDKTNFRYDEGENIIICPQGRRMRFDRIEEKLTTSGYKQEKLIYRGDCHGCQYLSICSKTSQGRTIQINKKWDKYKQKAKENLKTPVGERLRKQRNVDVESVFGDIKQNQRFKRFNLRGLEKVNAEFGLVAMAHNIKKIANMTN